MLPVRTRLVALSAVLLLVPAAALGLSSAAADPQVDAGPTPAVAQCRPGDKPETGMQGRIPPEDIASGRAAEGYTCHTTEVGHVESLGGWRVERYGDCAYYNGDPGGLPLGVVNVNPLTPGVVPLGTHVVDVSDPANPRQTAFLRSPAMLSPHESMSVHPRGLLVAVLGNLGTAPGVLEVYDISEDCRQPRLLNSLVDGVPLAPNVTARLGHEGQFSADGMTFYAGSAGGGTLTAVDLTDPANPEFLLTDDSIQSHGLSTSADGNLLYDAITGGPDAGLVIYDASSVQAREPDPAFEVVGRLTWPELSIPQSTIPVTIGGRSLLVEADEFGGNGQLPAANGEIGAARLIDVSDPADPFVVSSMRLEVHQPDVQATLDDDTKPLIGGPYTGHYCSVPQAVEPGIVACSMLRSGLRIFDVRDPERPREVAYFSPPASQNTADGLLKGRGDPLAPVRAGLHVGGTVAFVPQRREIWVSGQETGFHVIRVSAEAWPTAAGAPPAVAVPAGPVAPAPQAPAQPSGSSGSPTTGRAGGLAATGTSPLVGLLALAALGTGGAVALARRSPARG